MKAFDACPSQAEITAIGTSLQVHERSVRVPGVMYSDMADAGGLEHPCPLRRQSVRTQCSACLVYNHVAARFVIFAERQTVGCLDRPGRAQAGREVVGYGENTCRALVPRRVGSNISATDS